MTSKDDFDKASLRKQLDSDDLQREFSGLEVGRMRRFLPEAMTAAAKEKERRRVDDAYMTALQLLLLDPVYARAFADTKAFIGKAETAIAAVRLHLLEEMNNLEARLSDFRADASKLPDGTLVFIGENGEFVDERGVALDKAQQENVITSDNTPSWSDYARAQEQHQKLYDELEGVDVYERTIILPAKTKLEAEDKPLSLDELKDLNREIESGMPESVRKEFDHLQKAKIVAPGKSAASEYSVGETEFEKREVISSFDKARLEIPDLNEAVDTGPKLKFD